VQEDRLRVAEFRKAIKTLFLCRYVHQENLRREVDEGLNVIEQWNGANDFVFFARTMNWPAIVARIRS
jgi:TnpA family transposase